MRASLPRSASMPTPPRRAAADDDDDNGGSRHATELERAASSRRILPFVFVNDVVPGVTKHAEEYARNALKIITMGDVGCGKTSILHLIETDNAIENTRPTVSTEFVVRNLIIREPTIRVRLIFFDLVGQSIDKPNVEGVMMRNGDAALGVFDATRPATFESLARWKARIGSSIGGAFYFVVACNKADLIDAKSDAVIDQINEWQRRAADELGANLFLLTSARTGANCLEICYHLVKGVFQQRRRMEAEELSTGVRNERLHLQRQAAASIVHLTPNPAPKRGRGECCAGANGGGAAASTRE